MGEKGFSADPEEKQRRLTNVVKKLASSDQPIFGIETNEEERGVEKENFTAQRKKILNEAKKKPELKDLLSQKPVFYERKDGAPTEVHIEPAFHHLFKKKNMQQLLANPSEYIEHELKVINRGRHSKKELPKGRRIAELAETPYDISRVKLLRLGKEQVVIKRVDTTKVDNDLQEFNLAMQAVDAGISTPRPIGYIRDQGNTYLLFEYQKNTKDMYEFCTSSQEIHAYKSGFILYPPGVPVLYANYFPERTCWDDEKKLQQAILDCIHIIERISILLTDNSRERNKAEVYTLLDLIRQNHTNTFPLLREFLSLDFYQYHLDNPGEIDLKKFASDIKSALGLPPDSKFIELNAFFRKTILSRFLEISHNLAKEHAIKFLPSIEKEVFGASITLPYIHFKNDVERKSTQAGFKHKDLSSRNILITMYKNGEFPEPNDAGEAQFSVIDWEQK